MACPAFPQKTVRELLKKTEETGNEHGAVMCSDGTVTEIVSGGKTQMDISDAIAECGGDGPYEIIHTHPNGVADLSKQDREVAAHDDVESVCVAVEGGRIKCESVDACTQEVRP